MPSAATTSPLPAADGYGDAGQADLELVDG